MTTIYNSFKTLLLNGGIDLDGDTIRVALISDSAAYSPDIDAESTIADVLDGGTTAQELQASNYARKTLAVSVSQDNTDDEAVMDASDITWSSLGGDTNDTISGAVVYREVGADDTTPEDDDLIAFVTSADFPLPTNGGDVAVQFNAEGLINLG